MNYFKTDKRGFYGKFGGAYIPEMLYPNVKELQDNYESILNSNAFIQEYNALLKDYVGRPTPLYLAERLSDKYKANIWLKREDLTHTGAHKINNTIGQILLAKTLGKRRIIAETGAGQHGVATAAVCALNDLQCIVYMGETDIKRQAPNVARMKMLGAEVRPAKSGNMTLKDAVNEAIRDWINHPTDTHYLIGSVVGPHPYPDLVARLQSVISKEIKVQLLEKTGSENPDMVIACVGGGSNAAGAFFHFSEEDNVKLIAVEANGLGVHSNVAWFDSEATLTTDLRDGETVPLFKQPDMTANISLYYEKHGIFARLSYNYRGEYLNSITAGRGTLQQLEILGIPPDSRDQYIEGTGRVDFTLRYKIIPSLQIFFEAINLTNEPVVRSYNHQSLPVSKQYTERVFTIGVKWNL